MITGQTGRATIRAPVMAGRRGDLSPLGRAAIYCAYGRKRHRADCPARQTISSCLFSPARRRRGAATLRTI